MESRSTGNEKRVSYTVRGTVHSHRGRGKGLQAPTLNLPAPEDIPDGIYAGWATVQGQRYAAAIFVGAAITYGETERQLEVHVLDVELNNVLDCTAELVYFVRPNQQFAGQEALRLQIAEDIEQIKALLKV